MTRAGPRGTLARVTGTGADDATRVRHGREITEAAAALWSRQHQLATRYAATEADDGGGVVVVGAAEEFTAWLFDRSPTWRTLHSVRVTGESENPDILPAAMRNNRRIVDDGLQMVSVFAEDHCGPDVLDLLASQPIPYLLAPVPALNLKVVDGGAVLLEGPRVDGHRSLMSVHDQTSMSLARRYWRAVLRASRSAREAAEGRAPVVPGLTPRQRAVLALLARDVSDEQAAEVLDISVRTLRSEVAAVKTLLGVSSRFAAGLELGRRMAAARAVPAAPGRPGR